MKKKMIIYVAFNEILSFCSQNTMKQVKIAEKVSKNCEK